MPSKFLRSAKFAAGLAAATLASTTFADVRFWADENGDTALFNSAASWDPAPASMDDVAEDTLALNKGVDKIATVGNGDSVSVGTLYVGWGTTNGTDMAAKYDFGGRLDVTGGTLNVTNIFWIGGSYSDNNSNVVNVTGGRIEAFKLRTSDCNSGGGKKTDTLNISGTGVVSVSGSEEARFATYSGGETHVNVFGGQYLSTKAMNIGHGGKTVFVLDGGEVDIGSNDANVGCNFWNGSGNGKLEIKSGTWTSGTVNVGQGMGGSATGELIISGGTVNMKRVYVGLDSGTATFRLSGGTTVTTTSDSVIAKGSKSVGTMIVDSGRYIAGGQQFRIGEKGVGVLTMNGGSLEADIALELNGSSESVAVGTTLNLNGGRISVGQVNTKATQTTATINWNGGTLTCNGHADSWGGIFPASEYIVVNVLGGGAIYETAEGRESKNETIAQPLAGGGAFVKRGGGTMNLTGALDLKGGFKVEGGTLNIAADKIARTNFKEIVVSEGCTLNLNGASVAVEKYVLNGDEQSVGTYSAHNGTIRVMSPEEYVPASARWTNANGDNDTANPGNWVTWNAAGEEILDAPTADTPITVPYASGTPSFEGFSDVTWAVESNVLAEGYHRPDIIKTAAAWYDPSDTSTLTIDNGKVTGIANKGTILANSDEQVGLDLVLRTQSHPAPSFSTGGFNGRQSIYFGDSADSVSGFKSERYFPNDFPANGGRTMFAVAQGNVNNMIMLTIAKGSKNTEEGKSILLAHKAESGNYGAAYKVGSWNDSGSKWEAKKASFDGVVTDAPYVFAGRTALGDGDERKVMSSALSADGTKIGQLEPLSFNMPAGEDGTRFNVYYGSFEVNVGWLLQNDTVGYQGEALIFTNALSDAEMDEVNAYLKAKWLDPVVSMPNIDKLVINATNDLAGTTRTYTNVSGCGWFVDGTVVVTGDIVVTVNPDQSVVAPSFDKLVLGQNARLIVKGAKNLLTTDRINILAFNLLDGQFASVVGENGVKVKCRYEEDHVCAKRDAGLGVILR